MWSWYQLGSDHGWTCSHLLPIGFDWGLLTARVVMTEPSHGFDWLRLLTGSNCFQLGLDHGRPETGVTGFLPVTWHAHVLPMLAVID